MATLLIEQMFGPMGGIVAFAFMVGVSTGWGFAMKLMRDRINNLERMIEKLREEHKAEVQGWQDRYLSVVQPIVPVVPVSTPDE